MLGLLALDGERSGYDLSKQAEQSVGHVWAPTKSHLYAVLRRLSAQGLVSARQVAQERRPDKQLYSLTAEGQAALQAWLDDAPSGDQSGLVLRLFLGGLATPGEPSADARDLPGRRARATRGLRGDRRTELAPRTRPVPRRRARPRDRAGRGDARLGRGSARGARMKLRLALAATALVLAGCAGAAEGSPQRRRRRPPATCGHSPSTCAALMRTSSTPCRAPSSRPHGTGSWSARRSWRPTSCSSS